jgi:hypothetical protein
MAYIVPNSEVYLLKDIKITPTYTDTIFFANKTAQTAYFTNASKRVATLTNVAYQRHSRGWLKVGLSAGLVSQANYMMFKNTAFENKWFYAFITDWEYVNNSTTLISYMIDDIQTYFFDCTLGDCFVEREHAMNDTIGANRIPEPVGSNRVMMNQRWACSDMANYSVVVQASSTNRGEHFEADYFHQGQFNGLDIWVDDCNDGTDAGVIGAVLEDMVGDGSYSEDATSQQQVVSIIQFPTKFTTDGMRPYSVTEGFSGTRTNLSGYVPRNKKLLTSPFKQLWLTNGIGGSATLDYDDFSNPASIQFQVMGTFNGQGQIICLPLNYKGVTHNYDFKIVISEFPQCGYTLDSYRAWLAGGGDIKQKVNVIKGVADGLFGTTSLVANTGQAYTNEYNRNYAERLNDATEAGRKNPEQLATSYADKKTTIGGALGSIMSGAVSAVGNIAGSAVNTYTDYKMTEFESHAQPNIPVGMTAGNVLVGARELNFRCYDVDINAIDAQIIDEFFDKFGYQTNRLKVPNISGRKAWNYVKTRECELVGNIPASIKNNIITIFNSGITFWKNGDTIGDYSQDNTL